MLVFDQVVMEALPIAIDGHTHLIECVVTDGNVIASSCLGGQLKVWDAVSGEMVVHIERKRLDLLTRKCYSCCFQ